MLCCVMLCNIFNVYNARACHLAVWIVLSDCTLTPRGKFRSNPRRENQNKIKLKLVLNNFFVICRLILSRVDLKIDLISPNPKWCINYILHFNERATPVKYYPLGQDYKKLNKNNICMQNPNTSTLVTIGYFCHCESLTCFTYLSDSANASESFI